MKLKNWSFKNLCDFLADYGFKWVHTEGSHCFYGGRINGKDRMVQAISNSYERRRQSDNTMKYAVNKSGIPIEYFNDWKESKGKNVYKDIIG